MAMQAERINDGTSIELLDGVRWRKVSPRSSHSLVQFAVAGIIQRCAAGKRSRWHRVGFSHW